MAAGPDPRKVARWKTQSLATLTRQLVAAGFHPVRDRGRGVHVWRPNGDPAGYVAPVLQRASNGDAFGLFYVGRNDGDDNGHSTEARVSSIDAALAHLTQCAVPLDKSE